ncbi:MAG TPA: serine hydrolase [Nonomuraea sp.]|nr:serine hydrolase [Nonomuraea sp.]
MPAQEAGSGRGRHLPQHRRPPAYPAPTSSTPRIARRALRLSATPETRNHENPIPATDDQWLAHRFRGYQPEELVRLALSKPPRFEPGTDHNYSNTNYTLALLLIEKVTGRMSGTMAAGTRTQLPGPHAHGYYQYEDDGRQKVVDISRQNLSLLAEMRKPHPEMGYGLGLFVQDLGSNCGTVYQHNGSPRTATGR